MLNKPEGQTRARESTAQIHWTNSDFQGRKITLSAYMQCSSQPSFPVTRPWWEEFPRKIIYNHHSPVLTFSESLYSQSHLILPCNLPFRRFVQTIPNIPTTWKLHSVELLLACIQKQPSSGLFNPQGLSIILQLFFVSLYHIKHAN